MMIAADWIIREVVKNYPGAESVLTRLGLTCWGCPVASLDTVEMACAIHGLDPEVVVRELNHALRDAG